MTTAFHIAIDSDGNIWGMGESPEAAKADAARYANDPSDADDFEALPASNRLAQMITDKGWNSANPKFSWRKTREGVADLIDAE